MIKTQMISGIFLLEIMLGYGMREMSYIMKQLENAINIMILSTAQWGLGSFCAKTKLDKYQQDKS